MDVKTLFESSFFIKNWPVVLLTLISVVLAHYFLKIKTSDEKKNKKERLDGEEDIGADFSENNGSADLPVYIPVLEEKNHIPYKGATITAVGGAKWFYEMANNRRSVRHYSTKEVSFQIIEDCIRAAGTAPSGAHTEPWTFCIVSSLATKAEIRDIVESEEMINYSQRMHGQWVADLKPLKTDHIKPYLTEAPYLILIFKQTYGETEDGRRKQHYYHEISTAIATGILLCALQSAGLSSLVTTPLNCGPMLRTLLKRPKNEKLMVLMPVGYPAEDCCVPDLKRKELQDIMVSY